MLRELSPSPIICVEYERRRYFNWFVVCWSFLKMEGDGNLFPDGWFLDADDPSPAPPEANDPSPAPPEADDPSEAPPAKKNKLSLSLKKKARTSRSSVTRFASATTSQAVLQLPTTVLQLPTTVLQLPLRQHCPSKPLIVCLIITDSGTPVPSTTFVVTVFPLML